MAVGLKPFYKRSPQIRASNVVRFHDRAVGVVYDRVWNSKLAGIRCDHRDFGGGHWSVEISVVVKIEENHRLATARRAVCLFFVLHSAF